MPDTRQCKYAQGLDAQGLEPGDLPSRAEAERAGCGPTSVLEHRRGKCACANVDNPPVSGDGDIPKVHHDSQAPREDVSGHLDLGPDGGEFSNIRTDKPLTDWSQVFAQFNLDPDVFAIVDDTVRYSAWQQSRRTDDGDRDIVTLYAYRARFTRRKAEDHVDLPALYAAARTATPAPAPAPSRRATVVVYADPQVGKTGRRGGTAELLARSMVVRDRLTQALEERAPERVLLADAGDGIEGFESGGNPMFTNDLSLAGQLDVYSTELFEFINTCHAHAPVTVMGVPSNHAAWRNGKQNLGKPSDDLGLFTHRQVAKVTAAAGMAVDWVAPEDYDESVAVDFLGTRVGLVHGNQFPPGKAVDWWQRQTFGAGAVSGADILVHGHYHTFTAGTAGRNPVSDRARWCFGAPTIDNGSDWFRQTAGWDSDPGLLIFDVTEAGLDLGSLTIIQANENVIDGMSEAA